ncbi:MAG: NAD-dependent epimerase/dehydratase family protein [Nitrososphaerota archaeon]|nr:NAD-dependent epimerase/dehydratase family protein [Nitrososphaerota archaeon]
MPTPPGTAPTFCLKEDRSQVIGSLIRKAIRYPEEDFVVWGDGTQRRAFLYVDDFLDGLFRLDEYVETKGNLTVNLGSTEETTIKALAEKVIGISGKEITPKYDTTKPVGVLAGSPTSPGLRKPSAGSRRRTWPTVWRRHTSGRSAG